MRSSFSLLWFIFALFSITYAALDELFVPDHPVKAGHEFELSIHTLHDFYPPDLRDLFLVLSLAPIDPPQCDTCLGQAGPQYHFDLINQGHDKTGKGKFSEKMKAPSKPGGYLVTAAIMSTHGSHYETSLRFLLDTLEVD